MLAKYMRFSKKIQKYQVVGAEMYTYGGMFIKESDNGDFLNYRFNAYNFIY